MTKQITIGYKGFNPDFTCRGFQFEVGQTYEYDGDAVPCENGFHACTSPLDVWNYYEPVTDMGLTRYAVVEATDIVVEGDKFCTAQIAIKAELSLSEFIQRGVVWILERAKDTEAATGDRSAATNTGNYSAATNAGNYSAATNTGDWSAATNTGDRSASTSTGYQSAATNIGYRSAATNTGDRSAAIKTGYQSAATNTGDWSAATNTGNRSAATNTGYQSAATNTGDRSAATNTGNQSAASVGGVHAVAIATGWQGRVMAERDGCVLFAVERDGSGQVKSCAKGITGKDRIKAGVWYRAKGGKLVKVQS